MHLTPKFFKNYLLEILGLQSFLKIIYWKFFQEFPKNKVFSQNTKKKVFSCFCYCAQNIKIENKKTLMRNPFLSKKRQRKKRSGKACPIPKPCVWWWIEGFKDCFRMPPFFNHSGVEATKTIKKMGFTHPHEFILPFADLQ